MATQSERAEQEARRYLAAVSEKSTASPDYERALRKAAASIERLQRAVRLAERTERSR